MLLIYGNENCYCPYRDGLGIATTDGRVSWYQLLGVSQAASLPEIRHRHERRRRLVLKCRESTFHPVWDQLLEELDRALGVLTDPVSKRRYDADMLRRNRQQSLVRLPADDAEGWNANTRSEKTNRPRQPAAPLPGQSPGPRELYEPIRCIGDGPQGTRVYESWEYALNRRVAVRCLLRSARTPERTRSFLEEARFLASLSHPNLAEIHAVSERGCYMVMEYLEQTLTAFRASQDSGRCSPEFTTDFLRQSLSILERMHASGVVHGAIGLRSFHLTDSGVVKLVDAPGCTAAGLFRAPRADQTCVAPELLSPATFGEPGPAVDLYMLGFTALQLLAGDQLTRCIPKLTAGPNCDQRLWMQWHASPMERLPSLHSVLPGISPTLADLIENLCEKQVLDRCRSASEALQCLQRTAAAPVTAPVEPAPAPASAADTGNRCEPAAKVLGGQSPLLREARRENVRTPDLLEILQDPRLLWNRLRYDRRCQVAAGGSAALLFAALALSGSGRPTQLTAPQTMDSDTPSLVVDAAQDSSMRVSPAAPVQTASVPETPLPEMETFDAPELEPAALALDLPDAPSLAAASFIPTAAPSQPSGQLLPEQIPYFVPDEMDPRHLPRLIELLQKLRASRKPDERRQLYRDAAALAPQDPRIPFLYAAVLDFRPEAKPELEQAVALSPPGYSQPIRQSIQSRLTGPGARHEIADEILAELREFVGRLSRLPQTPAVDFDWQWTGRILGCLQQEAAREPRVAGMLKHSLPLILQSAGNHGTAEIQRGMQIIVADPDRSDALTLFPTQPEMASSLCLESLRQTATEPNTADSAIAASNTSGRSAQK